MKNFYSFKNEVEIRFSDDKKESISSTYFSDAFGNRISKVAMFIGPNASGKTNILKIIPFLSYFICDSFRPSGGLEEEIIFKPFFFTNKKEHSYFEIDFSDNNRRTFYYKVEMTTDRVFFEKLDIRELGMRKSRNIFERKYSNKDKKYNFKFRDRNLFGLSIKDAAKIRDNVSVISAAAYSNNEISKEIYSYFRNKIISNSIAESGKIDNKTDDFLEAINFLRSRLDIKKEVEDHLIKFDTGVKSIIVDEKGNNESPKIYGRHNYFGNEYDLPIKYESTGTKNIISTLRLILPSLRSDLGAVVIDELDSDLHPYMIPEIINIFTSKEYNPKNIQLIFSSHSVQAMNNLDKNQIILIEKDGKSGVSDAWHLSDVKTKEGKKIRSNDNYYGKYMSGKYGAIPNFDN